MGNILNIDPEVTKKITECGTTANGELKYAASSMKGWRVTMEDCHTLSPHIPTSVGTLEDHSLYAVMDGHGGNMTSVYAGNTFVSYLSKQSEMKKYASLPKSGSKSREDVTGVELLRSALTGAFRDLDESLRTLQRLRNEEFEKARNQLPPGADDEPKIVERSGSTCLVVMITPSHIICANAGDSRATLKRGDRVLPLSFDHKPNNLPEFQRISRAGGFVKSKRVDGDLAVSRGLGDFSFKSQKELDLSNQKVISKPDILLYPREKDIDEFIVLACDGVWDVASNSQCSEIVSEIMTEGESDLSLLAEEVLDICLEKNSRDNMTIIVVCFPKAKVLPKSSSQAKAAVANRRLARQTRLLELQAKTAAQNAASGVGIDLGLTNLNAADTSLSASPPAAAVPADPQTEASLVKKDPTNVPIAAS